MTTPEKAKGSQWERDVAAYFRERGFKVDRRYGAGVHQDKGDLVGLPWFVLECKNTKQINLSKFVDEAKLEAHNADEPFGVAVIKRRQRNVKDAYVVMTLEFSSRRTGAPDAA